ncbi:hypothetical protein C2E25_16155 [Geothermobacter hydrogeniphilus]|uniref:Uncharacterized protein n=1 Tax=Geothermobacter hydrogeniphilus TaxID=1969733 RepID=A0A2K2H6A4_9BACT|nr:hypothetical protein C2E25_16155 [Geothermobacter hydrogeniphilus]
MKIVCIERHGVDVAQSLRVRGMDSLSEFVRWAERAGKYRSFRRKMGALVDSPRCLDLGGGFALWQEYMSQADNLMSGVPGSRRLKLRYEKLLENPVETLESVAVFCGLDGARDKIEPLVENIDFSRAYVYRNSVELVEFAKENRRVLEEYGYA